MTGLEINYFAVLVATLMSVALGIIWYSPMICGRLWMEEVGMQDAESETGAFARGWRFGFGFFLHFAVLSSIAYLLRFLETREVLAVISLLAPLSACFLVPIVHTVIWEKRRVRYFLVNGGYTLLFVWIGTGIIAFWPW